MAKNNFCEQLIFSKFKKKQNNVKCFSYYVEHKIHNLCFGLLLI